MQHKITVEEYESHIDTIQVNAFREGFELGRKQANKQLGDEDGRKD